MWSGHYEKEVTTFKNVINDNISLDNISLSLFNHKWLISDEDFIGEIIQTGGLIGYDCSWDCAK